MEDFFNTGNLIPQPAKQDRGEPTEEVIMDILREGFSQTGLSLSREEKLEKDKLKKKLKKERKKLAKANSNQIPRGIPPNNLKMSVMNPAKSIKPNPNYPVLSPLPRKEGGDIPTKSVHINNVSYQNPNAYNTFQEHPQKVS